jgi:hypothetical protein
MWKDILLMSTHSVSFYEIRHNSPSRSFHDQIAVLLYLMVWGTFYTHQSRHIVFTTLFDLWERRRPFYLSVCERNIEAERRARSSCGNDEKNIIVLVSKGRMDYYGSWYVQPDAEQYSAIENALGRCQSTVVQEVKTPAWQPLLSIQPVPWSSLQRYRNVALSDLQELEPDCGPPECQSIPMPDWRWVDHSPRDISTPE